MQEQEKLSQPQFDRFRDFIYGRCGIKVEASKITLVSNRIRRRLKAGGFADFDAYYRHLTSPAGAAELEQFLDAITTNETHFFRTAAHFDWFKADFINGLLNQQRRGEREASLRVWSAACSTGEEPYSLAICLAENALRLRGWKLSIVGTDISETALKAARQAIYRERAVAEVSPTQLRRYFETLADGVSWQVRPAVRELVEVRRHNLLEPPRPPPFDCIFIRNVLIYFDRDSKRTVIANLIKALAPGGFLVVGPSEGIYDMLAPLVKQATYLYRKT